MRHAVYALALAGTLIAATAGGPASALAASNDPPSCTAFVQRYFQSGLPDNTAVGFNMVTDDIAQNATYAEGVDASTGVHSSLMLSNATSPLWTSVLAGSGTQYFSNKRKQLSDFIVSVPFDPAQASHIDVIVCYRLLALDGRQLSVSFTTSNGTTWNVSPLGCTSANVLYGTPGWGQVVVLSLGTPTSTVPN